MHQTNKSWYFKWETYVQLKCLPVPFHTEKGTKVSICFQIIHSILKGGQVDPWETSFSLIKRDVETMNKYLEKFRTTTKELEARWSPLEEENQNGHSLE